MIKSLVVLLIILVVIISGYWIYRKSQYIYPLPKTAVNVDLNKYAGDWYEIALIPNRFEKGCSCTKASYKAEDNTVIVSNSCYKATEKSYTSIKGKAWAINKDNSKLKVQFMWPFRGDYWVLYVDKNYKYALVGGPTRKYLWILARATKIPAKTYKNLVAIAKEQGFDITKLVKISHKC